MLESRLQGSGSGPTGGPIIASAGAAEECYWPIFSCRLQATCQNGMLLLPHLTYGILGRNSVEKQPQDDSGCRVSVSKTLRGLEVP